MNGFHSARKHILSSSEIFVFPNIEGFWITKLSQFGPNCIINSGKLIEWLLLGMEIKFSLG